MKLSTIASASSARSPRTSTVLSELRGAALLLAQQRARLIELAARRAQLVHQLLRLARELALALLREFLGARSVLAAFDFQLATLALERAAFGASLRHRVAQAAHQL